MNKRFPFPKRYWVYLIVVLVCSILLIGNIYRTDGWTGDKPFSEFVQRDWQLLAIFLVEELMISSTTPRVVRVLIANELGAVTTSSTFSSELHVNAERRTRKNSICSLVVKDGKWVEIASSDFGKDAESMLPALKPSNSSRTIPNNKSDFILPNRIVRPPIP